MIQLSEENKLVGTTEYTEDTEKKLSIDVNSNVLKNPITPLLHHSSTPIGMGYGV